MNDNHSGKGAETKGIGADGEKWVDIDNDWRHARLVPELKETVGRNIDWHNITHNWDKAGDVEILSATVYDSEFVGMHHRVRDLLEAHAILTDKNKIIQTRKGKRWATGLSTAKVYEHILSGKDIIVELTDEKGEATGETINAKEYAQFLRMLEFNQLMGEYALSEEELEKKFLAKEEIKIWVTPKDKRGKPTGKPVEVDYYKKNPIDNMDGFNAKKYVQTIVDRQVGLQSMGNLRDEALKGLHPENAGHVQFFELNINGRKEWLWLPTSSKLAKDYVSSDMRKIGASALAKFHVHGVGYYDENTSACTGFDYEMLQSTRKAITDTRNWRDTNARMYENAMGLASGETPMVTEDEATGMKTVEIGKERRGLVYKAMHNTYDEAMKMARGYELTDEEADDKIMTDIIIPFLVNNPRDWHMCFATTFGEKIGFDAIKAIGKENAWAAKNKFQVAIKCKVLEGEQKGQVIKRYFKSIDELIEYANARIALGEVRGVPMDTRAQFTPMTDTEVKKMKEDEAADALKKEEDKKKEIKELSPDQLRSYASLLKAVFGASVNWHLRSYWEKGEKTQVINVIRKPVLDAEGNQVLSATGQPLFDEAEQMIEGTGRENFTELLRKNLRKDIGKYSSLITEAAQAIGGESGVDIIVDTLNNLSEEGRKMLYESVVPPALRMSEVSTMYSATGTQRDPKEEVKPDVTKLDKV